MAYVPGLSGQVYRTRLQGDVMKTIEAQKRAQEQIEEYEGKKRAGAGLFSKIGKYAGKLTGIPLADAAGEYLGGRFGASRDYGDEPDVAEFRTGLRGSGFDDLEKRQSEFDDILKGEIEGQAAGTAVSGIESNLNFGKQLFGMPSSGGTENQEVGYFDDSVDDSEFNFFDDFSDWESPPPPQTNVPNLPNPTPVSPALATDDVDNMDWGNVDWTRSLDEFQQGGLIGMQMGGNIPRYQSGGLLDYILQPMLRDMFRSQG